MGSAITALIIGIGQFGRYYAEILSSLNNREMTGIPMIRKLIVSKTRRDAALEFAESLLQSGRCAVEEVVGVAISQRDHLRRLMARCAIQFVAIAAKDPHAGDAIHALYALEALKYGAVLCEKPFCSAVGDGASLRYFHDLKNYKNRRLFGLELPMSLVGDAMLQDPYLRNLLLDAGHIEIYWEARDREENDVINDLALHPWSLIPPQFKIRLIEVRNEGQQADIRLELRNPASRQIQACRIRLRTGGNRRAMKIDDAVFSLKTEGGRVELIKHDGAFFDHGIEQMDSIPGEVVLEVDNPLQQHIVAALRGQPIVGLNRAYQSQLFLEQLHGFEVPPNNT